MTYYVKEPKKCCDDCNDYKPCNNCECIELPIKGSDVIYRGVHLELLNIEHGDDYHKVISKINEYLKTIEIGGGVNLQFKNVGGGYEIFQKRNENKEVIFKTITTDDSINIQDYGDYLYIKTKEKLKIFKTLEEAQVYSKSSESKEGILVYVISENSYYKIDSDKNLSDPFSNKLNKPTEIGNELNHPYVVLVDDSGNSVKKLYSEIIGSNVDISTLIIAGEGLSGGGTLENDVTLSLSDETILKINKGVIGYDHSIDMGNAKTQIPNWSAYLTNQLIF